MTKTIDLGMECILNQLQLFILKHNSVEESDAAIWSFFKTYL